MSEMGTMLLGSAVPVTLVAGAVAPFGQNQAAFTSSGASMTCRVARETTGL